VRRPRAFDTIGLWLAARRAILSDDRRRRGRRSRQPQPSLREGTSMSKARSTTKIMIIRHAEKPPTPDDDAPAGTTPVEGKKVLEGPPYGANLDGDNSNESLIVVGWQRAGALACLLAPSSGPLQNPELATPQFLFASDSKSQRPLETIKPLGQKLNLKPSTEKKGDYKAIADQAMACGGIALVCWQHQDIPQMANHILGDKTTAPQKWPGHRFDVIWVFDLDSTTDTYSFKQVPQCLLHGDSPEPISNG
jgi:hypothetical protein